MWWSVGDNQEATTIEGSILYNIVMLPVHLPTNHLNFLLRPVIHYSSTQSAPLVAMLSLKQAVIFYSVVTAATVYSKNVKVTHGGSHDTVLPPLILDCRHRLGPQLQPHSLT